MSPSTSSLVASPSSQSTDGGATIALTFTAKDAQGHPLAGQTVTFNASGTSNTVNPTSATTDGSGTWTATIASPLAQTEVLTAGLGGVNVAANVTFTAGTPLSSKSSFTIDTNTTTADGSAAIHGTLVLRDTQNNGVPNATYTFTSTQGGDGFAPAASGVTDANGKATVAVTSTVSGNATLGVNTVVTLPTYAVAFNAGPRRLRTAA